MNQHFMEVIDSFVREACYRKIDRLEFFRVRQFQTEVVSPELGRRSLLIVHDGTEGTAVPPMCERLGVEVVTTQIPKYFGGCNLDPADMIFWWDITKYPELLKTDSGWEIKKRGEIYVPPES